MDHVGSGGAINSAGSAIAYLDNFELKWLIFNGPL